MEEEYNKDIMLNDLEEILGNLNIMNKAMQKVYIKISNIIKEATKDEQHIEEDM